MSKNTIITISREYGSGGREIANLLAEKLDIQLYDNKLITIAAQESGYTPEIIEESQRGYPNKLSMAWGMLNSSWEYNMPLDNKLFYIQSSIIRTIADRESAVIVGRCADAVLRNYTPCLNIFICGSLDKKIKHVMGKYGLSQSEAKERIEIWDKSRSTYYNFYTDRKWGDRKNYDIVINSDPGIEITADILYNFVVTLKPEFKR